MYVHARVHACPEVNLGCCSSDAVYIAYEIESPTVPLLTR